MSHASYYPGGKMLTLKVLFEKETYRLLGAQIVGFDGVDKAFAVQAGREIRVMVRPDDVNDDGMKIIAREMAAKIQAEMKYPGQIKVHLIRESRVADYAK